METGSLGKEARTQTPPNWWRSHSPPCGLRDSLGLGTARETDHHLQVKPSLAGVRNGKEPDNQVIENPYLFVCLPSFLLSNSNSNGSGSQTGDQNAEGEGPFTLTKETAELEQREIPTAFLSLPLTLYIACCFFEQGN